MRPWTSIADIEMVAVLIGRELRAFLLGDEIPKLGLLALEFTSLVIGIYPVGNIVFGLRICGLSVLIVYRPACED